jgi:hypothetical protein
MLGPSRLRNLRPSARTALWVAASLALQPMVGHARTLEMHVDSVRSSVAAANGLHARLDWADGAASGTLRVDADAVEAAGLGYAFSGLHWECPLIRDSKGGWRCEGDVRAGNGKPMRMALSLSPELLVARVSEGSQALSLQRDAATPDDTRLLFEQVPSAWLGAFVANLWTKGQLRQGTLAGRLDIHAPAKGDFEIHGPLKLRGFALETPDGAIAAGALDADARFAFNRTPSQRRFAVDLVLHGGELLAGGLYAALPKTPVLASLRAQQAGAGDWVASSMDWNDGSAMTAAGHARWSAQGLRAFDLQARSEDLGVAHGRYLTGWLDPAGFAGLQLQGAAAVELALDADGWRSAHAQLRGVDAIDAKQRFALHGLAGDLRWTADATTVASAMHCDSGALFGIPLGASSLAWRSQSRHLQLAAASSVPLLGGTLRIDRFDLVPGDATSGARFQVGLSLLKVQVAQLAKAFGWPAFGGTLDGSLPSASYANGVLGFDGGLTAQVFGGKLAITRLAMERPFGSDPSVSADIAIDDFDLQALTGVFGFGEISGRLDGSIRDLRLLDWTPIAFDAEVHSDDKAPDRRRISQRAVSDLSNVGGGGIIGGLQAQALKIFKDFGYARLGLSCRLANNVCRMDGVGSAGAGYTIVEGSGLPHITVVGFERQVDWPTLVARLKAATEGKVVIK